MAEVLLPTECQPGYMHAYSLGRAGKAQPRSHCSLVTLTSVMQGMTKERVSARKAKLAIWLRQGLVRLGPTFIKIGQQFSTRVDVLAPEFVRVRSQAPSQGLLLAAWTALAPAMWPCGFATVLTAPRQGQRSANKHWKLSLVARLRRQQACMRSALHEACLRWLASAWL